MIIIIIIKYLIVYAEAHELRARVRFLFCYYFSSRIAQDHVCDTIKAKYMGHEVGFAIVNFLLPAYGDDGRLFRTPTASSNVRNTYLFCTEGVIGWAVMLAIVS